MMISHDEQCCVKQLGGPKWLTVTNHLVAVHIECKDQTINANATFAKRRLRRRVPVQLLTFLLTWAFENL